MHLSASTSAHATGARNQADASYGRPAGVCAARCPLRTAAPRSVRLAAGADAPSTKTTPTLEKGTFSVTKRPPIYKVMLHNDNFNRREYVVRVLVKVVDNFCINDAVVCMQEAHETGVAMVTACAQDNAETYCEALRVNGLSCTIEPGC